ncbi:MAG TPA: YigZ family protein [Chryseolinea sp.]|nr:YigZ family protein [Chryseolinea sp.]
MPAYSFLTIKSTGKGIYKEKGSKFLAFAYPVSSESEIKERIASLKSEYFDARHHCFAWILGAEKKQFRAFDDGEPNHSAGDPILGQIRSRNLTDVLVVVVRYFGGTKLGVGGLIAAYKSAAEDALHNSLIVEKEVMERITLSYDYSITAEVMKMVKDFDMTIVAQEFKQQCDLMADVPLKNKNKFDEKMKLLNDLGLPLSSPTAPPPKGEE